MIVLAASNDPFNPVLVAIMVVVAGVVIVLRASRDTRAKRNLAGLAGRLGFETSPNMRIPSINRTTHLYFPGLDSVDPTLSTEIGIAGLANGRAVQLSEYVIGWGKNQKTWSELAVAVRSQGFVFCLRPDNILYKLSELTGSHEIKIGDDVFDRKWRIIANDREVLLALLLPELREKINDLSSWSGSYFLLNGWLRYRESGALSNKPRIARMEGMIEMMCELGDSCEVAAKNFKAPPEPPSSINAAYDDDKGDDWGEASPDYDRSP